MRITPINTIKTNTITFGKVNQIEENKNNQINKKVCKPEVLNFEKNIELQQPKKSLNPLNKIVESFRKMESGEGKISCAVHVPYYMA